jgi:hypothetical protein
MMPTLMRRKAFSVLAAVIVVCSAASAADDPVPDFLTQKPRVNPPRHPDMSGQYFCYVKGAGGLLRDDKGARFTATNLPADRQRFFLTLRPVKLSDYDIKQCKRSAVTYLDDLANGIPFSDFDADTHSQKYLSSREFISRDCLAKDEILIKYSEKDKPVALRSYELQFEFYGVTIDEWFVFFQDASYQRSDIYDSGSIIMETGQCEKIAPLPAENSR